MMNFTSLEEYLREPIPVKNIPLSMLILFVLPTCCVLLK